MAIKRRPMTPQEQAHFRILKTLEKNPELSQIQLAQQLGISVGKVNYLINALVDKGWIKIGNFQRSGNKLNKIAYLLTPEGIANRLGLTKAYLERKKIEYETLKAEIEALETDAPPDAVPSQRGQA